MKIEQIYKDASALLEGHFKLSSGNHSQFYLQSANIGVNPNNNGEVIKLFFPPMTVEQRQETAKQAKVMTDNAKVAIIKSQTPNTPISSCL